jgi:autotransporter-associated beta strand protein
MKPHTLASSLALQAIPTPVPPRPRYALPALGLLVAGCLLASGLPGQAATSTWSGAGGGSLDWTNSANWTGGLPTSSSTVVFTNAGATATLDANNVLSANTTINSLYYRNAMAGVYNSTLIQPGVTLTIISGATGYGIWSCPQSALSAASPVTNFISGANGTVLINPVTPQGYLGVTQGGTVGSMNTLDMSGLGTFAANVNRVYIGAPGGNGLYDHPQGTWKMALTNRIVCIDTANIDFEVGQNTTANSDLGGVVELGQTNAILADTGLAVGLRSVTDSQLRFGPNVVNGYAYFRNRSAGRQNRWQIGDGGLPQTGIWGTVGGGIPTKGTVNLSGGVVDALVEQVAVGRAATNTASSDDVNGRAEGYLFLDKGVLDANNVTVGCAATRHSCKTIGQVNVDGSAQLKVNNSMVLGTFLNINPDTSAKLNIGTISGGGLVSVYGNLYTITNPVAGASPNDSEIHLANGGALYVKGTVGPLSTLEINHGSLTLDYDGNAPGATPVCVTSNLVTAPNSTLVIRGTSFPSPGQYPLIQYTSWSGSFSDFATLTAPGGVTAYISNNVANSSIDLVITGVLVTTWTGQVNGVNADSWDIGTTRNWVTQSGAASAYTQPSMPGNAVVFDDSAAGTTSVNLTSASLSPVSLTVNNSTLDYTFSGSGGLTGITSLTKSGSGSLTLRNTGLNTFTGPIAVNGGTLQINSLPNRLPTNAVVTLANSSTLKLNGQNQMLGGLAGDMSSAVDLGAGTLTLAGGGVEFAGTISGSGGLVKTNLGATAIQTLSGANTYHGGTLIAGPTVLTVTTPGGSGLGDGSVDIENGATLNIGTGQYGAVEVPAITIGSGSSLNLNVNASDLTLNPVLKGSGTFTKFNTGLVRLPHANTFTGVTILNNGQLRISHGNALGVAPGYTYITGGNVAGSANIRLELEGGITTAAPLQIQAKYITGGVEPAALLNVSDTNTLTGPMTLLSGGNPPSDFVFQSDAGKLVMRGVITNLAGSLRQYYLRGAGDGDLYSVLPEGNNNVVKDDPGTWTLWGTNLCAGTNSIYAGTLVVNGLLRGYSLAVYGTLGGAGLITAPVTLTSGTLSPGVAGASFATLTLSNTLTLDGGSTCVLRVGDAGFDSIRGLTSVDYGSSTLSVVLQGTISRNASFKLFEATSYANPFGVMNLPTLPAPFTWDTSSLAVDGTLRVTGGPAIGALSWVGQDLAISGTGTAGQPYRILATTNLALPAVSWTQVGSGTFEGGVFSFTETNVAKYPQRFYRVISP